MKILLVEGCDFVSSPVGGQLSFCKQMVSKFSEIEIALVGVASVDGEPVGKWFKKNIDGKNFDCFNLYRLDKSVKPRIPLRLMNFISMLRYRGNVTCGGREVLFFIQSPELLISFLLFKRSSKNVAYFFHGVENPLDNPRYAWGKIFSKFFWKLLMRSAAKVQYLLAAADESSISRVFYNYQKLRKIVKSFPTRYDDDVFFPMPAGIPLVEPMTNFERVIVTTGRINSVKGWDFLVKSFHQYKLRNPGVSTCLVFVGDGEDTQKLLGLAAELNLSDQVFVTGYVDKFKVVEYLNSADLYVVGSKMEGWSIAMLEALACGLPIVSTDVSGARDLVGSGENGIVCGKRDVKLFGAAIEAALVRFSTPNETSIGVSNLYKASGFRNSLLDEFGFNNEDSTSHNNVRVDLVCRV